MGGSLKLRRAGPAAPLAAQTHSSNLVRLCRQARMRSLRCKAGAEDGLVRCRGAKARLNTLQCMGSDGHAGGVGA